MPPTVMRAAWFDRYGPPEVLTVRDVPVPVPGPGEVLVRVRATSVNAVDAKVRAGALRALTGFRFPKATGADFAGTVAAVGRGTDPSLVGRPVWGARDPLRGGAAAEYVVADAGRCTAAPDGLDLAEAAALPTVGLAALQALAAVEPKRGERLLVVGGSGGVGSALTQLASAAGVHVVTLSGPDNLDFCLAQGAAEALPYDQASFAEGERFDAVVDLHGTGIGGHRGRLRRGGRIASLAARAAIAALTSAVTPGPRVRMVRVRVNAVWLEALTRRVESGALRPSIGRVYGLDELVEAHRSADTGHSRGKRLVRVTD